jgi:hypothetical protein
MTDLKETTPLMTPRRGFFTRIAGVMALGVARCGILGADGRPNWLEKA